MTEQDQEVEKTKKALLETVLEWGKDIETRSERDRVRHDDWLLQAVREYKQALESKDVEDCLQSFKR